MNAAAILGRAFLAGAADLERHAPLLDRINVFPVVDADTGTNMVQTLRGTRAILEERPAAILEDTETTTRQLLRDARGNSGVIFSQFLVAFTDSLAEDSPGEQEAFTRGLSRGRELAYRAVSEPVEGTILTAIGAAETLLADGAPRDTLAAHGTFELELAAAVARTPELMPRLKEAGVVDAGALGFHLFASGLALALPAWSGDGPALERIETRAAGQSSAPLGDISRSISPAFLESAPPEERSYRYCINLLVELDGDLPANWQRLFDGVGSSVELATRGPLARLHLHGDDLDAARRAGEALGAVVDFDGEEMWRQLVTAKSEAHPATDEHRALRVVGDSSMSLPHDVAEALGAFRIENHVHVHGEMVEDRNLDREALFARMRDGELFTTAQTSAEAVGAFLDEQLGRSDRLFYIAVGRAYTGTQSLVEQVIATHPKRERVAVFDTRAAAGQQGIICLACARRAARASDPEHLNQYIRDQISTSREYLVIDNLKYLSRSGRIGRVKAAFAGALGVRPVVGHGDSGAITVARTRSHEEAESEVLARVEAHPGEGPLLVMIEHTDNRPWAEELAERFLDRLPADTELLLSPLSATSAVHMGPGTWGVAVTRP